MLPTLHYAPAKRAVINILTTANLINEKVSELLKPYEISVEQFNVLRILRGRKGTPANMSDIQERMIARMSNTTRLVEKLLAKEMVIRNICPINRRKVEIIITPKGLAWLEQVDPLIEGFEQDLTNALSDENLAQFNLHIEQLKNTIYDRS